MQRHRSRTSRIFLYSLLLLSPPHQNPHVHTQRNYEAERPFLEESDRLVQLRTEALKAKRPKREIDAINRDLKDVEEKAEAFVLPNDFAKIVQRE